jgi:hypothetical protein
MAALDELLLQLPAKEKKEITEMDIFLKSLPSLKFKRTIDRKSDKISYISAEYGISYLIKLKNKHQEFGWYYIHDRQKNKWYRKTDYMVTVFNEINPDIANRLFNSLTKCTSCRNVDNCGNILYEYKGEKRMTHYGRLILGLKKNDFEDAREFFCHLESLVQ